MLSSHQLEDPFVLRKALDVSRAQLWAIQERLDLHGEGGQSRQQDIFKQEKQDILHERTMQVELSYNQT